MSPVGCCRLATSEVPFPLRLLFYGLSSYDSCYLLVLIPFSSDQLLGNSREHTVVHGPLRDRKQAVKLYFLFTTIPQIFSRRTAAHCNQSTAPPGLTLPTARSSPAGRVFYVPWPAASRLGERPVPSYRLRLNTANQRAAGLEGRGQLRAAAGDGDGRAGAWNAAPEITGWDRWGGGVRDRKVSDS